MARTLDVCVPDEKMTTRTAETAETVRTRATQMRTRSSWTSAVASGLRLAALGATGGCTDGSLGSDPGTGTGTLQVGALVYASPRQGQAHTAADFAVSFAVRVLRGERRVTTGSVTITSASGKVPLTFRTFGWTASTVGYDEVYTLDVVAGPDRIEGVRVDGPGIHAFSQPSEGASIDTSAPLAVTWTRSEPAEAAALRPDPADWIPVADSGTFALPPGAFRIEGGEARVHTLRLARTNQIVPAGAAAESSFSVTLENDVHVIEPPLPL